MRSLSLTGEGITADAIGQLQAAHDLEYLGLNKCANIDDASLAAVGKLAQIFRLSLTSDRLTDAGLGHLQNLTGLRELEIKGPKFTGAGLAFLSKCVNITEIKAEGERIGDEVFPPLNQFPNLRRITVGVGQPTAQPRITDAGLAKLKSASLQFANFIGTSITNDGLKSLDALPSLLSANFPWSDEVNPPMWNRHGIPRQPRRRSARLPRPPKLDDAQRAANDALVEELKKSFGPRAVQSGGMRFHERMLNIDISSPLLTDEIVEKIATLANVTTCNLSGATSRTQAWQNSPVCKASSSCAWGAINLPMRACRHWRD